MTSPSTAQEDKQSLWGLSWAHFFLSASTIMVSTSLPVFLRVELGMTQTKIGLIEGIAVASAFASKVVVGVLSDIFSKRKPFILLGSFLSFICKPLFVLAAITLNPSAVVLARFFDRLSKGVRSSPADALVADLSPKQLRGKAFGIRQALYVGGCATGMLASTALLSFGSSYTSLFSLAAIPSVLALLALIFFTHDSHSLRKTPKAPKLSWNLKKICSLPGPLWHLMLVVFILMLGRFTEMFVILRAKEVGWPIHLLPLFLLPEFVIQALAAYPAGRLADRICTQRLFMMGLGLFTIASLILSLAQSVSQMLAGSLILGIHLGITQVLMRKMVAEVTPANAQGSAFALFHFVQGVAILLCNPLAGVLADHFGSHAPFLQSLGCSVLAAVALTRLPQKKAVVV